MITSPGLEVRTESLEGPKGELTKEHGRNFITRELSRMSAGNQGQVQKLTNFLEILSFALFSSLCVPSLHAVKRPPASVLC